MTQLKFLSSIPIRIHTFDSFVFPDYRLLWLSTTSASAGFWLQQVVIGWITYTLTQSPLLTSLALSLDWVFAVAAPVGGILADRRDRGKLLALSYVYQALLTMLLALIVFLGKLETWHVFVFITLVGLSWIVIDPARTALISNVVPKKNLVNAFALNSLGFSATRMVIPVLGGALLAIAGTGMALMSEVILQLIAAIVALKLPKVATFRVNNSAPVSSFRALMEAVEYIRNTPHLLFIIILGTVPWVVVAPFTIGLMPVHAAEVFDVGPTGLGILLTAMGLGSALGTVTLATLVEIRKKGLLVLVCIMLTVIAMVLFAKTSSVGIACLFLIIISGGMMVTTTITHASTQSLSINEFRGRVSGLNVAPSGLFPIGSLLAGGLAEYFGSSSATLIGAGILLLVFVSIMLCSKSVWRF
jgi:MFS family permease